MYLNELDWRLEEHGIRFVRYAVDFLLFAKTEEEIQKAAEVTREMLQELGLEVAIEITKTVNFKNDDFDFLGYTFQHWRVRKRDGKPYFIAKPKEATWKDFKQKVKAKTQKTLTLNKKTWLERVNPIIRGKVNYFLNLYKAVEENKRYGQESRCFFNVCKNQLLDMDGYVRQRLRVAMIHNHPTQRKGHAMETKWNNEFFLESDVFQLTGFITAHNIIYKLHEKQTKDKTRPKSAESKRTRTRVLHSRPRSQNAICTTISDILISS
ncbi:reverse transcriptase domain-containing protein [Paenibacillus sp. MER 180]|uniref:reverse transcriptase domain-containing protein n=1 Tax=Paenibacillus sp. MER 180 TaxID=2939570 RepID=UPI002042217B|nr:reverse transcriptase domain-containing protein [Paenibacillus sp. MER 180]